MLTNGLALTAIAAYGYGLAATTFIASMDAGDRCGAVRSEDFSLGTPGPADGSLSMWPLQDTSCGPDLVPDFVNPLVVGSVVLCLTSAATMTALKRDLSGVHRPLLTDAARAGG